MLENKVASAGRFRTRRLPRLAAHFRVPKKEFRIATCSHWMEVEGYCVCQSHSQSGGLY